MATKAKAKSKKAVKVPKPPASANDPLGIAAGLQAIAQSAPAADAAVAPVVTAPRAAAPEAAPTGRRNKSGFRGVYFSNRRQKFRATIKVSGKRVRLGSFATAEEASAAYEKALAAN